MSNTISSYEGYVIANIEIKNGFIQIDIGDWFITMKLRGNISDLVAKIALDIHCK